MDNGWIKIHRKLIDWQWFDKPEMVQLFVFFLLSANHESKKWNGTTIKRGQFVTSLESVKLKTGLSIQTIRTCIKRLKLTNEITSTSTSRFTIITICNYASYQQKENTTNKPINTPNNKQVTNEQQTSNKRLTTNKNDKNEKNIKERAENAKRFTPPSINDVQIYVSEKGYSVDAESFVSFYQSKNWFVGKNKMKDWHAAVVTWEKRNKEFPTKKQSTTKNVNDIWHNQ
ncbi:MAG: hypothetical protein PHX61_00800 [Alphaproteobacteria bacterium]|nr:hypothetical protein [Alphaproteobacteria bacterium]